jgi:hypothetical protein
MKSSFSQSSQPFWPPELFFPLQPSCLLQFTFKVALAWLVRPFTWRFSLDFLFRVSVQSLWLPPPFIVSFFPVFAAELFRRFFWRGFMPEFGPAI